MSPLAVHVKHGGKVHDVQLDPDRPASVLKYAIYQVTGVPLDRMKIMIKGGILKDDTDWKEGQTFIVIGAAGELPKAPEQPIQFLEDLSSSQIAELEAQHRSRPAQAGLKNLGKTCYMNATIQALRAIPELQIALNACAPPPTDIASSMRDLFASMDRVKNTKGTVSPTDLLQRLRVAVPQFAVTGTDGTQYAQQDAQECWMQIIDSLKDVLISSEVGSAAQKKFVRQYMMAEIRRDLICNEAPEEPAVTSTEETLKLRCEISTTTDCVTIGIMNKLDHSIKMYSSSLGRQVSYIQRSRLSRLPTYLTVHMDRFVWGEDSNERTKIMQKVEFPLEFDALELVTDELKEKLVPVRYRLEELKQTRTERIRENSRTKGGGALVLNTLTQAISTAMASETGRATGYIYQSDILRAAREDHELYQEEMAHWDRERREVEEHVDQELRGDIGCSISGLYDLVAIIAHEGAAVDSGHYTALVKKSVFTKSPLKAEDELDWYKFDDDNVSEFSKEKLSTLYGEGDDPSAYILLYRSKSL